MANNSGTKKVALLGASFSGKTTFRNFLETNVFENEYISTIGNEESKANLVVDSKKHSFLLKEYDSQNVLDTIELENDCKAALIFFDSTNEMSWKSVRKWLDDVVRCVKKRRNRNFIVLLCANKVDLRDRRKIEPRHIKTFIQAYLAYLIHTNTRVNLELAHAEMSIKTSKSSVEAPLVYIVKNTT